MGELTNKQLERLYRKVWERIDRLTVGGRTFGVDLPTLWIIAPELANAIVRIRAEARVRVEALRQQG